MVLIGHVGNSKQQNDCHMTQFKAELVSCAILKETHCFIYKKVWSNPF